MSDRNVQFVQDQALSTSEDCQLPLSNSDLTHVQTGYQLAQLPTLMAGVLKEVLAVRCAIEAQAVGRVVVPSSTDDGWLDSEAAAKYLNLSKGTFEKHVYKAENKIRAYRVGGKNLFKKSDLDNWVKTWEDKSLGYF